MARPGITQSEVFSAIDALIANDVKPTITAIREQIGTGSPNTIHRHLSAWRDAQPAQKATAIELPEALKSAMVAEIEKQAAAARESVEKRLAEVEAENTELAEHGSTIEIENAELTEKNAGLLLDVESLQALAAERENAADRERQSAESARVELAKAQNALESLPDLKSEVRAERDKRYEAEKEVAVLKERLRGRE